jgi:2-polyprenyl-6-methoxyphenol hydroxylase-like FAD-dependent oxidoreductase
MPRPRAGDDVAIRLWLLDPDAAAEFPNEDDLTLLVASFHRSRLQEVRTDLEGSYLRHLASLPDPPDLEGAQCVSKLLGKLELPNVLRPAAAPGIAFVGDAALATDPLFGAGITFAFQSAAWLVDETAAALRGSPRHLDAALARYRRKHFRRLAPHHLQMADYSTGRRLTALERLMFRRATHDAEIARAFGMLLARERPASHLLHPRFAARLVVPRRVDGEASQRRPGDDQAVALEEAA